MKDSQKDKQQIKTETLSRRNLLKKTAAGTLGVAGFVKGFPYIHASGHTTLRYMATGVSQHSQIAAKAKEELGINIEYMTVTSDEEVKKSKGYYSELNFKQRKEILSSIKYVHKIIPSKWNISDKFLKKHKIDLLIHGNDYSFKIKKIKTKIFKRTQKISSSLIRKKSYKIYKKLNK